MSENPFPGLRPFKTEEAHLFFGREGQSEEILHRLRSRRLVAVVGASGTGKSSLINAGLLPYLYGGFMARAGSRWRIATFRPGNDPIGNLSHALNDSEVLGSAGHDADEAARNSVLLEVTLRRSGLGLIEAIRLARLDKNENVLIVVDQFEELFRFADAATGMRGENDAPAFAKLLLEAAAQQDVPVYIVLTMRSDFIGDCARIQDLPEAVTSGLYLIPRMTRDQQRAAIEEPARVGGGEISPRLVNRLLNDIGDNPDRLPILQHALMRTWDYWQENHAGPQPLDLEHYVAVGTMAEALSRHADDAYSGLTERQRQIAKRLFQSLTEKGADNRELRRPTAVSAIAEVSGATVPEVIEIIELFRRPDRSFLTPPAGVPLRADSVIDISHESLIRGWTMLREWVNEEFESAKAYKRLAETVALADAGNADILRGPDLSYVEAFWKTEDRNAAWASRYHPDFKHALDFMLLCEDDRDKNVQALERARVRELRRLRLRTLVISVALAAAVIGLGLAAWQSNKASRMAGYAEAQLKDLVDMAISQDDPAGKVFSKITEQLESQAPSDPKLFDQLFMVNIALADLRAGAKKYDQAEQNVDEAGKWADRLPQNNSRYKFAHYIILQRRGTLKLDQVQDGATGDQRISLLNDALKFHQQSMDLTKDESFQPDSRAYGEYNVGYDYFNLGQLKDAQAHWAKVAEVDPGDMKFATLIAAAYTSRATSDHTDKKNDEALRMTDLRIATLAPFGDSPGATSEAKTSLASAYAERSWYDLFVGDYSSAISDADKSVSYDSAQIVALTNKVDGLIMQNRIEEARRVYLDNADKPEGIGFGGKKFRDGMLGDLEVLKSFKLNPAILAEVRTFIK